MVVVVVLVIAVCVSMHGLVVVDRGQCERVVVVTSRVVGVSVIVRAVPVVVIISQQHQWVHVYRCRCYFHNGGGMVN